MDKKDLNVLHVADKYVQDLHEGERAELWRDYWEVEGRLLASRKEKE